MKFAFCLFKYFPFGGMQRDFLHIVKACRKRGHLVDVFAGQWQGKFIDDLRITLIPCHRFTNHRRGESFAKKLSKYTSPHQYDALVGFNKMPGLDVYFAADSCFAQKAYEKGILHRLTGRYRTYLRLEHAVFHKSAKTEILLLSLRERAFFVKHYDTQEKRFHLLPPGISRDYLAPENSDLIRSELRSEFGIQNKNMLLMVGSGFKTKGVDRSIRAVASLSTKLLMDTLLMIVGDGNEKPFQNLAKKLNLSEQVIFVGGRNDVQRFFVASDLLLHPARRENTGTVLIESMAAGLPVLATDICGYGYHVKRAEAGQLIPSPFSQGSFNQLLEDMLLSKSEANWAQNGRKYVATNDVFSMHERAVDIIEKLVEG